MIAENEIYLSVKSAKNPIPLFGATEAEVTEVKDYIIRSDDIVPVRYDCLVHFMNVAKRTLAVADYIRMVKVGI